MTKPVLLDLFCGAGGAATGYARAGFEVVGVDIAPQPRYPFSFVQHDALDFPLLEFDVIHASPPCQHYAAVTAWRGLQTDHPDLVPQVREALIRSGRPYVIENVREAKLVNPLMLCGTMFGLPIRRHRYFESNVPLFELMQGCRHRKTDLAFEHKQERAYGDAMGCPWMVTKEHREAVPPAYTEEIGRRLMAVLAGKEHNAK